MAGFRRYSSFAPCLIVFLLMLTSGSAILNGQGYGGPSMLSRGGNSPGRRGRSPIPFNVYMGVRATYDNGLTPVALDPAGTVSKTDAAGVQFEFGAFGSHTWRRSILALDYRGNVRRSNNPRRANGSNHAMVLNYNNNFAKRFNLNITELAGTTNRAYGGFTGPADIDEPGVPTEEIFDSRVYFLQSAANVSYTQNSRLSYYANTGYFITQRQERALNSLRGYRASGGTNYRLDGRTSIGGSFDYIHFDFPRIAGQANAKGFSVHFQRQLNRNLNIVLLGGASHVVTSGTQPVALSPEVAAILGTPLGLTAFEASRWVTTIRAQASYTLAESRFQVAYNQGVRPGNGVYLTTQQRQIHAGYSYSGLRRSSVGLSAAYTQTESLALRVRGSNFLRGGGGWNYRLFEHVDLSTQLDYRNYSTPGLRGRKGISASVGLLYTPSRFPLPIW